MIGGGRTWVTLGCQVPAHPSPLPPTLTPLTDELQKLLLEQMELRKKLEREFQSLKGTPIPTHLISHTSPLLSPPRGLNLLPALPASFRNPMSGRCPVRPAEATELSMPGGSCHAKN